MRKHERRAEGFLLVNIMAKPKDLTHKRFGKLTALARAWHIAPRSWIFVCDCGAFVVRDSIAIAASSKRGAQSCCRACQSGIKAANGRGNNQGKGSTRNKRVYDVHRQMMRRCFDRNSADFPNYGARGILVCEQWHQQSGFYEWAFSSGYRKGLTLERIDVNGNYCPENCTWIPNERQALNTRKVRFLSLGGRTMALSDWATELGIRPNTIKTRLRLGWDIESALTTKPGAHGFSGSWKQS